MIAASALADNRGLFAAVQGALTGVPPPEIPLCAANLVVKSPDDQKESTTTNVILAVVEMNPCTIPSTLAQITRTSPDMAPLAAATAVSLQPNQVYLITMATVGTAPARAPKIVSAVIARVPTQFIAVAATASQVVPSEETNILNAVSGCLPVLRPYIEKMITNQSFAKGNLPVDAILNQCVFMALHDQSASPSPSSSRKN